MNNIKLPLLTNQVHAFSLLSVKWYGGEPCTCFLHEWSWMELIYFPCHPRWCNEHEITVWIWTQVENSQQHRQVDQTLTHGQMTIQIWLNLFRRPELYTCWSTNYMYMQWLVKTLLSDKLNTQKKPVSHADTCN